MPQRWRSIAVSLLATSLFFTSCKKQFSSDTSLPTSYYPSVIINDDNQVVYAFDPTNGNKNWEFGLPVPSNYTALNPSVPIVFTPAPLLYNEMVYITYIQRDPGLTDTIYKVNAKTGVLVKKIVPAPGVPFNIQATPIADGGLLYIAGTNNNLYAIDTGTYVVKWAFPADGPLISSPTIYNGNLYFASTTGTVFCVDENVGPAGTSNWKYLPERQGDTAFYQGDSAILVSLRGNTNTIATFYSSPAIAPPYLYIGSVADSNMYCIYLTPTGSATPAIGIERWRYKVLGGIYSSPAAVAGTCIFGGSDFHIYCLDTTIDPQMEPTAILTPSPRWIDSAHSSVYSSPYVYNQVVYIGSHDYNLYALNIINGGIKWQFASKGLIKSSPVVYNGTVYIGSYDKNLYAIDSTNGVQKWFKNVNGQVECSPVIDDLTGNSYNSGISGYNNGGNEFAYLFNANNF